MDAKDQWCLGIGFNGCALAGGTLDGFGSILGAPHGDCMLTGFVGFEREEARSTKIEIFLWSDRMIQSKEIKKIPRKKQSIHSKTKYVHKDPQKETLRSQLCTNKYDRYAGNT